MKDPVYLAGYPCKDDLSATTHLEMIHCTDDARPYLTRNNNGLKLTRHHANLYLLSIDNSTVKLVEGSYNTGVPKTPTEIVLRDEDKVRIQEAINTNYFFD